MWIGHKNVLHFTDVKRLSGKNKISWSCMQVHIFFSTFFELQHIFLHWKNPLAHHHTKKVQSQYTHYLLELFDVELFELCRCAVDISEGHYFKSTSALRPMFSTFSAVKNYPNAHASHTILSQLVHFCKMINKCIVSSMVKKKHLYFFFY